MRSHIDPFGGGGGSYIQEVAPRPGVLFQTVNERLKVKFRYIPQGLTGHANVASCGNKDQLLQ